MASNPNNTPPPEAVEEPSELDILMGRSAYCYNHVGNQAFRTIIDDNLGWYASVMYGKKREKIAVVSSVMNTITHGGGWFLRQSPHDFLWYRLDYKDAREKVTHALRNQLKQRTTQSPLVLQANKHLDYDWGSLVRKAAKFKEDRKEISQESERIISNRDVSTDRHTVAKDECDRVEASFGESQKWFRPFLRDTLQESTASATGPIVGDPRGYMGSGRITALPSLTMHGSHNDSFEPIPIQPVHPSRNKPHHGHGLCSIESNDGGIQDQCVATKTSTHARSDDIPPAPIMSAPQNVITPPQGPRSLSHQLLAKRMPHKSLVMPLVKGSAANVAETLEGDSSESTKNHAIDHTSFCRTTKSSAKPDDFVTAPKDSCPPADKLLTQRVPGDFLLPRQVSLEQETTDNNVTETSAGGCNRTNDRSPICGGFTKPSKPLNIPPISLTGDANLGKEEMSPWNKSVSAFLDSSCANSERTCRATLESSENDDEASVDLEKLLTGLQDIKNVDGSCENFMDSSCESTVCSCCFETREDHDDASVDLDSLMMDLDDTEQLNSSSDFQEEHSPGATGII